MQSGGVFWKSHSRELLCSHGDSYMCLTDFRHIEVNLCGSFMAKLEFLNFLDYLSYGFYIETEKSRTFLRILNPFFKKMLPKTIFRLS